MASKGFINSLLNSLPDDIKRILVPTFQYTLDTLRFGHPDDGKRAENFQIYWFSATTPAIANTEFSIHHGLQLTPTLCIPVLPLDVVGASFIPLTVTRVADTERVYFKSSSTNTNFSVGLEV